LRERYAEQIESHPLKREIIATYVVNSMINRVGSTFVSQLQEETGAAAADIVRAYLAARQVFDVVSLWQEIEALDNVVADSVQTSMILDSSRLVQRGTLWFLRHRDQLVDLSATLARFSPGVQLLATRLRDVVTASYLAELDAVSSRYTALGVPDLLAQRVAGLDELYSALDLVMVAEETGRPEALVASVYFDLGGRFDLHWLGRQISALPADTHWQGLARTALRDDLSTQARNLAADVLSCSPQVDGLDALVSTWESSRQFQIERCRQLFADLRSADMIDMSMLSVLLRELRSLV
jgi:glutamate dehydrogenase